MLGTSPPSSVFVMKGLRFAFKSSTGVKVLADPQHERNNGIVPKSRKEALENDNRPHNTEKSTTAASDLLVNRSARPCVVVFHLHQQEVYETHTTEVSKKSYRPCH